MTSPAPPHPRPLASATLAAALERLPGAGESTWLRGLLAVVATVLALAAWAFVAAGDHLAANNASDAEALGLAGRQVHLGLHLAAQAHAVGDGETGTPPLDAALARMRDDAVRLHELRGVWGEGDDGPEHWTQRRERLWAAAQSLEMARERGEPRLADFVERVEHEAHTFIDAMGAAMAELQRLAEARHTATRHAHAVLVGVMAAGVISLLFGLGEPLARRIAQHRRRLLAQADELRRNETELRSQRNLLQTTIAGAGLGTWNWDMAGGGITFNAQWARMLGLDAAELPADMPAWQALLHPEDVEPARLALRAHLADPTVPYRSEYRMPHRGGGWVWVLAAGAVVERSAQGRALRMTGVNIDINAAKGLEQALADAALTDSLTQLPNRAGIQQALARCVLRVHQQPGEAFAVLFMDFDRFKLVNDSLGHDAGDELLRQIAHRVKQALRPGDDVALRASLPDVAGRLGGDEFVVLLERLRQPADATRVAERLLEALAAPYALAGRHVQSSASIGIVTSDVSSASVESVLRDADTAMYEAKRRGRGRYVVFDPEMHRRIRHAMELEADLRQALQQDAFYVVYQPIVGLPDRRPQTLEALVRWRHPLRGMVSPAEFVPLAEEAGLIDALGEFVLRRACADLAAWQRQLGPGAPRSVAVNLSRAQLIPGRLAALVCEALHGNGLAPTALRLEITETLAMQGESALAVLAELRELGVGLALDDFGTGYSSLASLDQLPIDTVKIDRAFVNRMVESPYQAALVKSTVQVAGTLGLAVVAEGVETEAQLDAIVAQGCHAAQGFLFSRPMEAPAFAAWWAEATRDTAEDDALAPA